jgi:hypothetical protein
VVLGRAALDEAAQGFPAAAGGVAALDEADAARFEQIDEPGGGVAAIEQEHIAGAQLVQGVGEHRALGFGGGADLGVQREFGTRQVQREAPAATRRKPCQRGRRSAVSARASSSSLRPLSAGTCRWERALAKARSLTLRAGVESTPRVAKTPSSSDCCEVPRMQSRVATSVGSGNARSRVKARGWLG